MSYPRVLTASAVAATLALAGCANSPSTESKSSAPPPAKSTSASRASVDSSRIESRIAAELAGLQSHGQPSFTGVKVNCPRDIEPRQGAKFDCGITANQGPTGHEPNGPMSGTGTVTLSDPQGQKFALEYKLTGVDVSYSGTASDVS